MAMEIVRNKARKIKKKSSFIYIPIIKQFSADQIIKLKIASISLQKVSLWKKFYLLYSFFFVRKIVAHLVTFIFYCLVLPATILVPEVQVPKWGVVYIPSIITLLNAVGTPRSCPVPFM